jgi:putative phosphoribosyl transferase
MVRPSRVPGGWVFRDRSEAGCLLGERLSRRWDESPVVLALPRGGVPVAVEVAAQLGAPLDVIIVRKLGLPFRPETGFGAVGECGVRLVDADLVHRAGLTGQEVAAVEERERRELDQRVRRYRGGRPPISMSGRTALIVDDGLATGATARAAVGVARTLGAHRVVLAVPVAPPEVVRELGRVADEVVSLATPERFVAVGLWYDDFGQISDDQVGVLLGRHAHGWTGEAVLARDGRAGGPDPAIPLRGRPVRQGARGRPARSRPRGRRPRG